MPSHAMPSDAGASTSALKEEERLEYRLEDNTLNDTYMELIWILQRRAHLYEFEFHEKKCN